MLLHNHNRTQYHINLLSIFKFIFLYNWIIIAVCIIYHNTSYYFQHPSCFQSTLFQTPIFISSKPFIKHPICFTYLWKGLCRIAGHSIRILKSMLARISQDRDPTWSWTQSPFHNVVRPTRSELSDLPNKQCKTCVFWYLHFMINSFNDVYM